MAGGFRDILDTILHWFASGSGVVPDVEGCEWTFDANNCDWRLTDNVCHWSVDANHAHWTLTRED